MIYQKVFLDIYKMMFQRINKIYFLKKVLKTLKT